MAIKHKDIWGLFIKFLLHKNCYSEYYRNYQEQNYIWFDIRNKKHIKTYNPYEYINMAFGWSETMEGHRFWSSLNDLWRGFYCSHIKNNIVCCNKDEITQLILKL